MFTADDADRVLARLLGLAEAGRARHPALAIRLNPMLAELAAVP
jgi:hypothetical protein